MVETTLDPARDTLRTSPLEGMTPSDIHIAALYEAVQIAEAEELLRGRPVGTRDGLVASGCAAVVRRLKERIAELMGHE